MNRRHFLKQLAILSLIKTGSLYLPRRAFASNSELSDDHFFVLLQVSGGWDITLSLDPHVHKNGLTQEDIFLEYTDSEILRANNNPFLAPAADSMMKHAHDIHIIRGVEMRRDAGHTTNLEIMSSGFGDGFSALFPVELAATTQEGPMGVLIDNSILTGARNGILTNISSISQNSGQQSDFFDSMYMDEDNLFSQTKEALFRGNDKITDIQSILSELSGQGFDNTNFAAVAAAFKSRSSFQASMVISGQNLDTHSQHEGTHLNSQREVWQQISTLFDYFKNIEYGGGKSLFDHTTFLVVSEFARTPALNASAGKDHNPHANGVLLAGKGIQGGKATGETFIIPKAESKIGIAEHISRPINFKNGEIIRKLGDTDNKDINLIFPENISTTIGSLFGNPKGFYENKGTSKIIPGVIKS